MDDRPTTCRFCRIIDGLEPGAIVFEDDISLAFLDTRPLFPGHTLLVPKQHYEILSDLPSDFIRQFFSNVQMLSKATPAAMEAEGSFVAVNNTVSQSIPHLHVHVVPRNKGDGLKGFFWPRQKYRDERHMEDTRMKIRNAVNVIRGS